MCTQTWHETNTRLPCDNRQSEWVEPEHWTKRNEPKKGKKNSGMKQHINYLFLHKQLTKLLNLSQINKNDTAESSWMHSICRKVMEEQAERSKRKRSHTQNCKFMKRNEAMNTRQSRPVCESEYSQFNQTANETTSSRARYLGSARKNVCALKRSRAARAFYFTWCMRQQQQQRRRQRWWILITLYIPANGEG